MHRTRSLHWTQGRYPVSITDATGPAPVSLSLGTALGKNMSKPQKIILIVGLVWCAICALFAPRPYIGGGSGAGSIPPPHVFFFPRFQMFHYQEHLGNY